ncbi:C-C motif chemokine 9-like [Peromyscus eremicus]|uniref:C-C motif chemokine 9-like n=1 Tax=Peromyscus eremicus TaxID=42410 RepID=UPI0027DDBEF9|nr:C-C motif chemokine 9-like [Peromyscus eremicus]
MKSFPTPFSFLLLAAALGFQAQIIHATETKEVLEAKEGLETDVLPLGFGESSDCCFFYTSWIKCSRFVYYFPTSGSCLKPGIIFVTKKRNQVCANPSDPRVQGCIKRLTQNPRPGNQVIV